MLASISFPAQNERSFTQEPRNKPASQQQHHGSFYTHVDKKKVAAAITEASNNKAPGPDGITAELIKELEEATPGFLVNIVKSCFRLGYYPKAWRKARGIVIPKPEKPDYTKAKTFRTISLLNVFGKIVEKVAAEAIMNHMEKKGSLHQGQYGGQRKRGAIDAVARMVVEAEEA